MIAARKQNWWTDAAVVAPAIADDIEPSKTDFVLEMFAMVADCKIAWC